MSRSLVRNTWLIGLVAAWFAAACTDEEIVYVDRELFNPPADAASGFLGYYDRSDKLTTCGNCHVGTQSEWEESAHADAYATLDNSGHAQTFCYSCHTVNELGNTVATAAGWNAVQDTSYHDVQCESCHGPGLEHVTNPEATQPYASVSVGLDLTVGCAECHQGTHHPFAEEWEQSGHAQVVTYAADRPECQSCHRGQATLATWGVTADYTEKNSADHLPVACAVCHDPHGSPYESQLRFPVNTVSSEEHLCARCHDRRSSPDPTATSSTAFSPHSPETDLLLGNAGWYPPGAIVNAGDVIGTHGSEANERLCATCHVNRFEVTDSETGEFAFQATGHLFEAIPCVGADGIPNATDCEVTDEARSFQGCTTSGCHGTEGVAAGLLSAAVAEIEGYADDLLALLTLVDANLTAAGGAIHPADGIFTVAEGAYFNYRLATHHDNVVAGAAHNPFLMRALLIASIDAVEDEYGVALPGSGNRNWDQEIRTLLARMGE